MISDVLLHFKKLRRFKKYPRVNKYVHARGCVGGGGVFIDSR